MKQISTEDYVERTDRCGWQRISEELDEYGNAHLPQILSPKECDELAALYPDNKHFRSRVVMERFSFGRGECKYFSYPLPEMISGLRTALYLTRR